jgi:probable rRNA maturation factor
MLQLVEMVLKSESATKKAVDIIYCGDFGITRLNDEYKAKNRSTDVLAFNLDDADEPHYLGEVYVNLQMAKRQARENDVTYDEEVKRLTVHGVLHLLGYRDNNPANRQRMWNRQESYLHDGKQRR